jgi:carbamoyl-phosphate synthase large subunit
MPLAKLATRVVLGARIAALGVREVGEQPHVAVKEAVFPFVKFPGVDVILGPEMRSTGEVMGIGREFRTAYLKSQLAAGSTLPRGGKAFLSVRNRDKRAIVNIGRGLTDVGFRLVATQGTAKVLERHGLTVDAIHKVAEGWRPNIVDLMKQGEIALVINTPEDGRARRDSYLIRRTAVMQNIPYYTTMDGAQAALEAIEAQRDGAVEVRPLQAYYEHLKP